MHANRASKLRFAPPPSLPTSHSVRLLKWPDSIYLQIWEQNGLRDSCIAQLPLPVPGLGGTPHIDPRPAAYCWSSPTPVPHQRLLQAATALAPLGALPLDTAQSAFNAAGGAAASSSCSITAVYPSGRIFVRSGWVSDRGEEPVATPFAHIGAAALMLHVPQVLGGGCSALGHVTEAAGDASVRVQLQPHRSGAESKAHRSGELSNGIGDAKVYTNPLATLGCDVEVGAALAPPQPAVRPDQLLARVAAGSHFMRKVCARMCNKPRFFYPRCLATLLHTIVATRRHASAPGMRGKSVQQGRAGIGLGVTSRAWLVREHLDPNDPRNASLLELLDATAGSCIDDNAQSSASAARSGLFRLELPPDAALTVDRTGDQRTTFIKQRWRAGMARGGCVSVYARDVAIGNDRQQSLRSLSTVAPLSSRDTLELRDAYTEALAMLEAASLGHLGGCGSAAGLGTGAAAGQSSTLALAAALAGRQERAAKWTQGALARAIETREAGMRCVLEADMPQMLGMHGRKFSHDHWHLQAYLCVLHAGLLRCESVQLLSNVAVVAWKHGAFALTTLSRYVCCAHNLLAASALFTQGIMGPNDATGNITTTCLYPPLSTTHQDAPLPEFKLDLSALAAAIAPARPLRPRRRAQKRLQVCWHRECCPEPAFPFYVHYQPLTSGHS